MDRWLLVAGGKLGFLAVALGAFGTHGLRDRLDEKAMSVWQTGVQYHLAHAMAILLMALISERLPKARTSGWLFVAGVIVFSGTLYLYATTGITAFAMVTPLGGLCFLLGWAWLAWSAFRGT